MLPFLLLTDPRIRRALAVVAVLGVVLFSAGTLTISEPPVPTEAPEIHLPAIRANPIRMDTLFLGGYAQGNFAQALQVLASDLSTAERTMIGRHLDRIFAGALQGEDMRQGGRLRLAYERATRPDGSTRSIRVLAAEAAVAGQMHTAFFFEHDAQPGYFDVRGRSLDTRGWIAPLARPRITSPFNTQRIHPILNRVLPHVGVDYAAPSGTPVRVTGDGSITVANWRGGYGNLVEVQHPNGYTTRYAHLSRIPTGMKVGTAVRQGDVIGYVGMTGLATGPHLHYEVRRQGRPVNPEVTHAAGGFAAEVAFNPIWSREREQLGQLLARAPRTLTRSPSSPGK